MSDKNYEENRVSPGFWGLKLHQCFQLPESNTYNNYSFKSYFKLSNSFLIFKSVDEVILWWPLNLLIETSCLWIFSVISMSDMSDFVEREILVSPSRHPAMTSNWNYNNYIQLHEVMAVKLLYIVNMHQCFSSCYFGSHKGLWAPIL